jgi:nicotinamide mononucleotide (NMN) deamidase PncC
MLDDVVARIHASGRRVVLAVTGGGSSAIAALLRVPGASRTVLEAIVPYDAHALGQFLGREPPQACSPETATAMSRRALERAAGATALGLGVTAALATDRPRRGPHRCHIALADDDRVEVLSIVLAKGRRDRPAEEELVGRAAILALAHACGITGVPAVETVLGPEDRLERGSTAIDLVSELVAGTVERITALPDGELARRASSCGIVLPGSFNPLHAGHLELARVASAALGAPVVFELSVLNVDKPPLTAGEVRRRLGQFAWRATVELTRAPTFREKARLLPGCTFVIGADTARRLIDPRYYEGSESRMLGALEEITRAGGRFLVAGRVDADGRFVTLAELPVPAALAGAFMEIPEERFRRDVASTTLRRTGA